MRKRWRKPWHSYDPEYGHRIYRPGERPLQTWGDVLLPAAWAGAVLAVVVCAWLALSQLQCLPADPGGAGDTDSLIREQEERRAIRQARKAQAALDRAAAFAERCRKLVNPIHPKETDSESSSLSSKN